MKKFSELSGLCRGCVGKIDPQPRHILARVLPSVLNAVGVVGVIYMLLSKVEEIYTFKGVQLYANKLFIGYRLVEAEMQKAPTPRQPRQTVFEVCEP
jgi:hypothetical protein